MHTAAHADFRQVDATSVTAASRFLALATAQESVASYRADALAALAVSGAMKVLDVGCGRGEETLAVARNLGPDGHAVGLDASAGLVAEAQAQAQAAASDLPVEFIVGDVYALPFADETFDAVRIDRVLHLLDAPEAALSELLRVLKPGGRLVAIEPDWRTLTVGGLYPDLSEAVLAATPPSRSGQGRNVPTQMRGVGFERVDCSEFTGVIDSLEVARVLFRLDDRATRAVRAGAIGPVDRLRWMAGLSLAELRGQFTSSLTGTVAVGHKAGAE